MATFINKLSKKKETATLCTSVDGVDHGSPMFADTRLGC